MPESKTRRNRRKPQPEASAHAEHRPLPVWYKPIMFGLMLLGLLWIMVYYITQTAFPIPGIDAWNIVIGFGLAMIGFFMTTGWR